MNVWLYDIIKGYDDRYSLKDNQRYCIENAQFRNSSNPTNETIFLNTLLKRNHFNNNSVYCFLKNIEKLITKNIQNANVVLFNEKDYENNHDQIFIEINGDGWDNFTIETGNFVGHLKYKDHQINISSRFGNQFLKYIIGDADGFLEIENLGGINNSDNYNWLLQYYWITKLKKAYCLGLPKVYEKQTHFEFKVKGQVDVVDFELNKSLGKVKSTSRNHSYGCDQNLLIVQAFKKINNDFMSNDLFSIKQAFNVSSQGRKKSKAELLRVKPFTNPFYSDYNEVLTFSKILLNNGSIDVGNNSNTNGFLFDVSMLFEYFIRKVFKRNGFYVQTKNERNYTIPTGTSFHRNLFPDLLATFEGKSFLFDVKYKRYDDRFGVKREDLFQIYTYLSQVSNNDNVDYFGFIYPTTNKHKEVLQKEKVYVLGKEHIFLVAFLYVPKDSLIFQKDFTESITIFINQLKNLKTN